MDEGDDGNRDTSQRDGRIATAADLARFIERRISAGTLAAGDRLEPVRALADQLGLAPNTVAAAYRVLGERGLLIGRGRSGTFVASRPVVTAPVDDSPPPGLLDLANGTPDPGLLPDPAPVLRDLAERYRSVGYGAPAVDEELISLLRHDLAADLSPAGLEVEHLTVVGGALDGIERVLTAQLRPGDRVGVEDPGYGPVFELLAATGLRAVPMAGDDDGVTPDGLASALADRVSAVIVTPRAHNPTGAAFGSERAATLRSQLAERPEVTVIEDDHANRVAGVPHHTVVPPGAERWATVRSVAKSLGPDLRLAAVAGDATTVSRVRGRLALGPGWVSHLLQQVVVGLLADPGLPAHLDRAAAAYTERRALVVDRLAAAGVEARGRSGLNVWVPVEDEGAVVAALAHRGFAVRSGARYRRVSPPGVRLTVAGRTGDELDRAVSALLDVLIGPSGATRSA